MSDQSNHSLNFENTNASTEPVGQESQSTQVLDQLQPNEQSNAPDALGDPEPQAQQNTINQDPTGNTVCGQNVAGVIVRTALIQMIQTQLSPLKRSLYGILLD
ncbi:hypothetical protein RhiXN_05973 [Rhizoctonia solani]|uniref:Uncharacterized protein n=1 Tax=Rhizoctonia solani TaxID=456999 RepID=A0A8H8SX35_9AGAM|nr:uncharacterized protein RhiXN_05973 [Rhizoctonia solani]QRW20984.1 hypothetical protein RhiXN_05973 [Rhizoctonia solani]